MSWLHNFAQYAMAYDIDHWPVMRNWETWTFEALFVFVPAGMLTVLFILPLLRERRAEEGDK
jgi:hypothetical protein